jgi:Arc/MetJ family transcription regulator
MNFGLILDIDEIRFQRISAARVVRQWGPCAYTQYADLPISNGEGPVERIGMAVYKTTIELDPALVARAREVLGTSGFKDTVEAALREVIALDARLRVIADLQSHNIDADKLRDEAWSR